MDVVARTGRTSALRRARAWHEQERGAERRDAAAPGVRVAGSRARRPGSSSPRAAPSSHLTANWETEENRLETLGEEREETSHGRTRHHGPREKCGLNTAELLSASAGPGTRSSAGSYGPKQKFPSRRSVTSLIKLCKRVAEGE
ncbi:hypothetical protein GN956_G9877 [Arapaima gigas]